MSLNCEKQIHQSNPHYISQVFNCNNINHQFEKKLPFKIFDKKVIINNGSTNVAPIKPLQVNLLHMKRLFFCVMRCLNPHALLLDYFHEPFHHRQSNKSLTTCGWPIHHFLLTHNEANIKWCINFELMLELAGIFIRLNLKNLHLVFFDDIWNPYWEIKILKID